MQLRNGKTTIQLENGNPTIQLENCRRTSEPLSETIRGMMDVLNKQKSSVDKLNAGIKLFQTINQQSDEALSTITNKYQFLATLYRKTVEFTCELIQRSYNSNKYSDIEKTKMIRFLSELYQARVNVSRILWDARTQKNIQDMMESDDGYSELLYRCLKHIVSDESESLYYDIHLYEDGEYTDVELYDWYLLQNYDGDAETDSYIVNADHCFAEPIFRFNEKLWQ